MTKDWLEIEGDDGKKSVAELCGIDKKTITDFIEGKTDTYKGSIEKDLDDFLS